MRVRNAGQGHAQVKRVSGQGRWYYSKPQVSWDIRSYTLYRGAEE